MVLSELRLPPPIRVPPPPSSNPILSLWRGEYPLWVTYWIFGALGTAVLNGASMLLYAYKAFEWPTWLLNGMAWAPIAYWLLILVSIWRAADYYNGPRSWANAAKVMVVVGLIVGFGRISANLTTKTGLIEEVRMINIGLPKMLDDMTRMDRVAFGDGTLSYYYTLTERTTIDFNVAREMMLPDCELLGEQIKRLTYHYSSLYTELATIELTAEGCADPTSLPTLPILPINH